MWILRIRNTACLAHCQPVRAPVSIHQATLKAEPLARHVSARSQPPNAPTKMVCMYCMYHSSLLVAKKAFFLLYNRRRFSF